jgi:DNA-binding Lrp family transcriptional regulator
MLIARPINRVGMTTTTTNDKLTHLTDVDKKILKILLTPNVKYSSKALAKKLALPPSTVQRRRKRLENEFLRIIYTLDLKRFGWHKVDFLIATESGKTDMIAKSLLKLEEVTYVGKSIGQHTIDLRIETILKDNSEILRMMEMLKATSGIKEVVWTEIVEVVGSKTSIPGQIIDRL